MTLSLTVASGPTVDLTGALVFQVVLSTSGVAGPGVAAGGATGQVLAKASGTDFDTEWVDQTGGGGAGTVTSVAMTVPTGFALAGSPITGAGTFALTFAAGYQGYTAAEAAKVAALSGTNTGDQDLSGYATTAAVAAGYQPLDSDLSAIAALTTTSFGRSFLSLADAAAARTLLALGTAALSASGDFAPIAHVGAGASAHANVVASGAAGFMTGTDKAKLDAISGTNTGDQTSIVGITGTKGQFNTAATDGDFVFANDALGTPTSGALTNCTADGANAVGFRNVPKSGSAKTTSYQLATTDVGKYIEVGSGGSITVPAATFAAGDAVSIFNNTSGNVTLTMSITTAYIGGTDSDKATITLATRGVATVLFISGTVCVVSGNVS